jgi:hypothetical protein
MASAVLEAFQYELEEEYVRGPAAPQEAIESWFILYYNQALLVGTLMKYKHHGTVAVLVLVSRHHGRGCKS